MAAKQLMGLRVALLATDGFEQSELLEPRKFLESQGAETDVVSPKSGKVRGWKMKQWGDEVEVDKTLDEADANEYDALVLPGGVMNADTLRTVPRAGKFIHSFIEAGKPIAAICHAPWALIELDAARGHRLTSWPSLKTDLENAGAQWVDEEVVVDGKLVTSRKPDDLPAFNREIARLFGEHRRTGAGARPAAGPVN
jgi:protease I